MTDQNKHHVVIVGGGFGGVKAALELTKHDNINVTLVSEREHFRYYPTLYHTATGGLRAQSSIPLQTILPENVTFVLDTAAGVDRDARTVKLKSGKALRYDSLILALGSVTNYFGIKGLPEYSYGIKSMEEIERFKQHLHQQLTDEHQPDLHYVIVGAGPTGIELAGALPHYLHQVMRNHGIKHKAVHIDLIEAGPRLLPRSPKSTSRAVRKQLRRLGIKLYLSQAVQGETADAIVINGKPLKSHTVVWTADRRRRRSAARTPARVSGSITAARSPLASSRSLAQVATAISVRDLRKAYGAVEAVRGVDFEISTGEVFALLGPNGAGKTTTVEILEGYRARDHGDVSVLGCDPQSERSRLKPRLGIVLQSTGVEPYLTVAETLRMYASFYPRSRRVDEVIELVGLAQKRNERVVRLSGGQQRRLELAIAFFGDPDLLFLDEPTTGFDPSARRDTWDVIKNLTSLGKTIVLTTHFMDEAQYLADRVLVIAAGRVVAEGPPSTLGFRDRAQARIRYRPADGAPRPALAFGGPDAAGFVEAKVADAVAALYELTRWAMERGVPLEGLEVTRPTLEDVYLALTDGAGSASEGGA